MENSVLRKLAEDLRGLVQAKGRIRRDVWVEARDEADLLYLKEEVIPDLGLELVSVRPQISMPTASLAVARKTIEKNGQATSG